ncbi:MAG: MBL fold metallo-hydrolase [Nitrospinae bacterium]|nr:MBL fold metallo-hydrolase [Nitrospinota bacterium]
MALKLDYDNAISITRDIYWVGFYDREANLHCNPYVLIDDEDIILIDPGSIPHFSVVMRKVIDLVDPESITYVVAHHQDPDVAGNLAVVEEVINSASLQIVAHSNTVRLLRHYGLRSGFYAVDKNGYKLQLKSGRTLDFIFTPYLHAPGAIVTYDSQTKTLFTSDIFGAISQDWSLFANGDFLSPMERWHELYMPSSAILRPCMEMLEKMDIERILPQHGSVLEGENVRKAIGRLKNLKCGVDLV